MENLKEFYTNIKNYSRLGIKSFINSNTENLKPSLLIDLNSEFVDLYLDEMKRNKKKKSVTDLDYILENMNDIDDFNSSVPEGTDNIIERRYTLVDGIIEMNEKKFKQENLSYRDYNRINYKILDFQSCMQEIIEEINTTTTNLNNPFSEPLDLSNTTGVEKIIYLHKTGVIDFLRKKQPFNTSVNALATFLSAVTGEKVDTLQSYLNPMFSKGVAQRNNPLSKTDPVNRVEKQLIKIGFNLDETN